MKRKILFALLCLLPMVAKAEISYRVEQNELISSEQKPMFASDYLFYVGGMYNFSMWDNGADDSIMIKGEDTSGYDVVAGIRLCDVFRLEADYLHTSAKWNAFEMTGEMAMINAAIDARIESLYRVLYKQSIVPYIGIGGGVSWNSSGDVEIEKEITPVATVMAGLGIELGKNFTLDFGYRYLYMFSPKFNVISDFAPVAHQFRAGARINF